MLIQLPGVFDIEYEATLQYIDLKNEVPYILLEYIVNESEIKKTNNKHQKY